jgi:hypothetical protein
MVNVHTALFIAAAILFLIAALPTTLRVRCEWLAFACLVVAYLV